MDPTNEPIRVLLVDDEEDFLLATSQALTRRGFTVSAAPNGVTALEKVAEESYDVVVLDVKMPDINGVEVFGHIRTRHPGLPVMILTGHPSVSDAFATSKHGIADYMSKPVDMNELADRLRQAVTEFRRRSAEAPNDEPSSTVKEQVSVLIVDDERDLLDSLRRVFTRRNLTTFIADSGPRALDLLREQFVDVMVLDVKMPGMDGLEVLRRVKERYPSIQVILLSGHPSVEAALEGVKLGASEYLRKPPVIDELIGTIMRLFRRRQEIIEEQQRQLIEEIRRRYAD